MSQTPVRRTPLFRRTNTIQQAFVEALPDIRVRLRRDGTVLGMEIPTTDAMPASRVWTGALRDHLAPHDADRWIEHVARCLDTHDVQTDTQTVPVFGRPLLFEVRLTATGDDEVLAVARDISAREEALRRLEANHRLVTAIAQNFPGCLYVIDAVAWRPVYVNRSVIELLGYDRLLAEQTLSEQLSMIASPEQQARVAAQLRTILRARDDETPEFELDVRDAEGRWRALHVRSKVFSRGADGRVQDIFCIVEDVTDRKIAMERLRHGQKLELLGQLAGVVVHDFNNIITSVRGYAELLIQDLPGDSLAGDDARIIISAMDRAAGVARRLLAFSRNEATRPRVADLSDALRRMVPLLRGGVGERYQVEVRLMAEGARALIDPVDLEQCVLNLVLNARDAMPRGGVISVTLSTRETDGRSLACIGVEDRGTGVDPAVRARLFEPFFTTKSTGQGTGLGLASVQRILSAAQGTVEVESELGVGSTFTLVLPRYTEPEAREETPFEARPTRVGGARILVVEDDEHVRRLVVEALGRDGHSVRGAADAEGALAIAREERFELVVSDVVMPGTPGPALVGLLRAIQPSLAVLFISGYFESPDIDPRQVQGARLLLKPFSPEDLLAAVRVALEDGALSP